MSNGTLNDGGLHTAAPYDYADDTPTVFVLAVEMTPGAAWVTIMASYCLAVGLLLWWLA